MHLDVHNVAQVSMCRPLQWCHNESDGVSNHRRLRCLLNCCFRRRSKKSSKVRGTGFCAGNSPVTGEFPAQKASNVENVSIWWRHYGTTLHIYSREVGSSEARWLDCCKWVHLLTAITRYDCDIMHAVSYSLYLWYWLGKRNTVTDISNYHQCSHRCRSGVFMWTRIRRKN